MPAENIRILHLSDLHICASCHRKPLNNLKLKLHELSNLIKNVVGDEYSEIQKIGKELTLDVGTHDHEMMTKLVNYINNEVKPDIICITGDITTFGDPLSFIIARAFIKSIGSKRKIILVPGNHDYLLHHFVHLKRSKLFQHINLIGWIYWIKTKLIINNPIFKTIKEIKNLFDELLSMLKSIEGLIPIELSFVEKYDKNYKLFQHTMKGIIADIENPAKIDRAVLYKAFVRIFEGSENIFENNSTIEKPYEHKKKNSPKFNVVISPLDSTTNSYLNMNRGIWKAELDRVYDKIQSVDEEDIPNMNILMLHHNPFSSQNVVEDQISEAYNGLDGPSQFLYKLQEKSVCFLIHGHQHYPTLYKTSWNGAKGRHIHVSSVSPALINKVNSTVFKVYDIISHNRIEIINYTFEKNDYQPIYNDTHQIIKTPLSFEADQINDALTIEARREIKYYRYKQSVVDHKPWNEISDIESKNVILYHFGYDHQNLVPRFEYYAEKIQDDSLKELNILMFNKDESKFLRDLNSKPNKTEIEKKYLEHIDQLWHKENFNPMLEYSDLQSSIQALENNLFAKIADNKKDRVKIKFTKTLIPFGAAVRNPDSYNAVMVVKILLFGAYADKKVYNHIPVVKLEKRQNETLFQCYWDHLLALWKSSDVYNMKTKQIDYNTINK